MSKKSCFGGLFDKQHGKRAKALLKSASQHLYLIDWSLLTQLSWKKYLLLICQMLWFLLNTLVADEKCPLQSRDNLTIPIQMQLSPKEKTFSQFLVAFSKSIWNFELFQKKDDSYRFCIYEITECENMVR